MVDGDHLNWLIEIRAFDGNQLDIVNIAQKQKESTIVVIYMLVTIELASFGV